jgi:hypothetical protein
VALGEASEHGPVDILGNGDVGGPGLPCLVSTLGAVARAGGAPEQPLQQTGHAKLAAPRFQFSWHGAMLAPVALRGQGP